MSLNGLDTALSGLRVAQQQMSVISGNIANATTVGYSRKILPQDTFAVAGQTIGVLSGAVTRDVSLNLSQDFWTQTAAVSGLDTTSAYMQKIQAFHGDPTANTSVASAISKLDDAFTALSDTPDSSSLQAGVVTAAQTVVQKVNGFSGLLNSMRNTAQADMSSSVATINGLLSQVADDNKQIAQNLYIGKTAAATQDDRDNAIQQLSQQIQVSTYVRKDGTMVVQTKQGQLLADTTAFPLTFRPPGAIGVQDAYPKSVAAVYIGDPKFNANAVALTADTSGGKLGALMNLRDTTLPKEQAELDEMSQKMAQRFDSQGLRLFTDASGTIPSDAGPVAGTTAVAYVGFATNIQVNSAILNDNSLVQKGTVASVTPVQSGSNEVIRRIVNNTFGSVAYSQASGTADLRASASGGTTLQKWLGLSSTNQINSTTDLANYSDTATLISAGATAFNATGVPQTAFTLTFGESRTGTGPVSLTVDLAQAQTDFPSNGTTVKTAADQIAAEINKQITASAVPSSLAAAATVNSYGQLTLKSTGDITVSSTAGQLSADGLKFIGLTAGVQKTTDPSFTVQVGDDNPQTITIGPADTETTLMAKLQYNAATGTGVPGLYARLDASGKLSLRPGDDTGTGPSFGGDITLTSAPFTTSGAGTSGTAAGLSVLGALFGNTSPVTDVTYAAIGQQFRTDNLGPGADLSTGVLGTAGIADFAQQMVNSQTGEAITTTAQQTEEKTYLGQVQKSLTDQSGVNIDDELSHMITTQSAYAAAAKVVSAINDSFQQLLQAIS